jgi:hypothetical protein
MARSPLPSSAQPIGFTSAGAAVLINQVWQRFFNSAFGQAGAGAAVTLTGTPFPFLAGGSGNLLVVGGTVSDITLTRGTTAIPTGLTAGFIPVANGDTVTITYSVAPTVTFIPA